MRKFRTTLSYPTLCVLRALVLGAIVVTAVAEFAPAQTVQFVNDSNVPFQGWARTTTDTLSLHRAGVIESPEGRVSSLLGRAVSADARAIDFRVKLAPGQRLTLDLAKAQASDLQRAPLPADPEKFIGGKVTFAGELMHLIGLEGDGAGWLTHWRNRVGKMFCVDLWVHHCIDQPWARCELLLTCSNPAVPDLGEYSTDTFILKIGDAAVCVLGRPTGDPVVDGGTWFGDGQARGVPLLAYWPRHIKTSMEHSSIGCEMSYGIGAVGISKLLTQGNPRLPSGFNAAQWTAGLMAESIRRLHTWEEGVVGPAAFSGRTGAQEDQVFVRGEALVRGGAGAERIAYLGALAMAKRPCHHLEGDGSHVDVANHPALVYWDSRPHWHTGVSPDRLGKEPGPTNFTGWLGADVEHWFHNTTFGAARLTGSSLVQELLSAQAHVYMAQHTTRPELIYQSVPFASRAWGWECLMATHWKDLADRTLAARADAHFRQRMDLVLIPQLMATPDSVIDWRRDDRLGPGLRYTPWQLAVGGYFADLAGEQLKHPGARALGLHACRIVARDALWFDGTRWTFRDVIAQDGAAVTSGYYDFFGSPLAAACVVKHGATAPADDTLTENCRQAWAQLVREAEGVKHRLAWMAPEVK